MITAPNRRYPGPATATARPNPRWWIVPLLVICVSVLGSLLSFWTVQRADREKRKVLQHRAELIAEAINVNDLTGLTGTEADLETPRFRRLKEQLTAARRLNQS